MERVSKSPEIRKKEILDTAMKLFYLNGFDNTTMADIAKKLNVVQGLCYRYFPSKQELYEDAMNEYIKKYCEPFLALIHDRERNIEDRLDSFFNMIKDSNEDGVYHDFLHKAGNEKFHEQLSFEMCKYLMPDVYDEFKNTFKSKTDSEIKMIVAYIVYGQMSIWNCNDIQFEERITKVSTFTRMLIKNF